MFQNEGWEATLMATEMRRSGVDVVGDMSWGTHFCLFYETKADLLETLVPYCKAGLESQEFCLWVVAEPLTEEDAKHALKRAFPEFGRYLVDESIEIVSARDWYLRDGAFDLNRVIDGWHKTLARASARGYAGVRVTGDTAWLEKKYWKDFCEYEESLNEAIANQHLAVLCTYPLAACGGAEILDVVRTHQFAVVKRRGSWDVIETAGHKQAKAEIKRLNDELEERVVERTSQLTAANEALTKEVLERQHAEDALRRVEETVRATQTRLSRATQIATMAEFAASIAHEINQPLTAVVANGHACMGWLSAQPPNLAKVHVAAERIVRDGNNAGEVVHRIRALFKRDALDKVPLDMNEVIGEVVRLLSSETAKRHVDVETELENNLPPVVGDRVQLQQLLFNLLLNGIEAMDPVVNRPKKLMIRSKGQSGNVVMVEVHDCGVGLPDPEKVFEAFFTTKENGLGMGLPVCRSILEAHDGRLWAASRETGTTFFFTLPAQLSVAACAPTIASSVPVLASGEDPSSRGDQTVD
jgi:signal transduction histidine kinase